MFLGNYLRMVQKLLETNDLDLEASCIFGSSFVASSFRTIVFIAENGYRFVRSFLNN